MFIRIWARTRTWTRTWRHWTWTQTQTWTFSFQPDSDLDSDLRVVDLDLDLDLAIGGLVTSLQVPEQKPISSEYSLYGAQLTKLCQGVRFIWTSYIHLWGLDIERSWSGDV